MELEFSGHYDRVTLFKAVALANKPSPRKALVRYALATFFVVVYIAYFALMAMKDNLSAYDIARSGRHLITLPFLAYFLFQPYLSAYLTASRLWQQPVMRGPFAGTVSSQGIAYISATARRDLAWGDFARIRQTPHLVAMLTASGTLAAFPRQFFKSEADWQQFIQWANYKVVEAQ